MICDGFLCGPRHLYLRTGVRWILPLGNIQMSRSLDFKQSRLICTPRCITCTITYTNGYPNKNLLLDIEEQISLRVWLAACARCSLSIQSQFCSPGPGFPL